MRLLSRRLTQLLTAGCLFVTSLPAGAAAPEPIEGELFASWVGRYPDLTTDQLLKHLHIGPSSDKALSFKPSSARFYAEVVKALGLSAEAKARLEKEGVLLVPQDATYSMAAALHRIYTADLPLLVTTDSVLDAMHRSFDAILADLEQSVLRDAIKDALFAAQQPLRELATKEPGLAEAAADCDLYLTVAMNLLEMEPNHGSLLMAPRVVDAKAVQAVLAKVHALALENPGQGDAATSLYGSERAVDWSQFKPRGHYTESPTLERYFRAMMWLGRADTGFEVDHPRQLRAAALLTRVFESSGAAARLKVVRDVVELMVGRADNLGPEALAELMRSKRLMAPGALTGDAAMKTLGELIAGSNLAGQRIRSQYVVSLPDDPQKTEPPPVFQLFGQGFVLDSFVLSKVVYDDIVFHGEKQERRMPWALDVLAALGNDEAVRLLKPELDRWHYGANLATLRDVIATWSRAHWEDNLYTLWLDALRSLNDAPKGAGAPELMRRTAWARKMTQTQLASWAQLRHDTILYAKQSETASAGCVYPVAYVEPYVAFYEKLGRFAQQASKRFGALSGNGIPAERVSRYVAYFDNFTVTMKRLQVLAEKELASKPFSADEERFLKSAIKVTRPQGGYMPKPDWSGWYVGLVFIRRGVETDAVDQHPTIADVHTDPDAKRVLEVGTGNVDFTVAAIDNNGDRALYVGPTLSFYEFTQPAANRLTDPQWEELLATPGKTPARPAWLTPFIGK